MQMLLTLKDKNDRSLDIMDDIRDFDKENQPRKKARLDDAEIDRSYSLLAKTYSAKPELDSFQEVRKTELARLKVQPRKPSAPRDASPQGEFSADEDERALLYNPDSKLHRIFFGQLENKDTTLANISFLSNMKFATLQSLPQPQHKKLTISAQSFNELKFAEYLDQVLKQR